jgi:hypothetical protein
MEQLCDAVIIANIFPGEFAPEKDRAASSPQLEPCIAAGKASGQKMATISAPKAPDNNPTKTDSRFRTILLIRIGSPY